MDPITIAMGLAQFAPQVLKWITGSDKAADAASAVVAQQVTGKGSGAEAFQALKADPALVLQFRQTLAAQEADLDKAFLADTQDARKRDTDLAKLGQRNRRADAMFVLAVAMICALVWIVWRDPGVNEYLKGTIQADLPPCGQNP